MAVTAVTITPETALDVLTLEQAKQQLRLEDSYDAEDALIQSYIATAVTIAENYLNAHIQPKELEIKLDQFVNYQFTTYPVSDVVLKYYKKDAESLTTVSATDWYLESKSSKHVVLVVDNAPTDVADRPDAVVITAKVGYTIAGDIPPAITQAIKLQVSDMFERREDRAGISVKVSQNLLRPYRKYL